MQHHTNLLAYQVPPVGARFRSNGLPHVVCLYMHVVDRQMRETLVKPAVVPRTHVRRAHALRMLPQALPAPNFIVHPDGTAFQVSTSGATEAELSQHSCASTGVAVKGVLGGSVSLPTWMAPPKLANAHRP